MKPSDSRQRPEPIPISHPSEARANVSYILVKPEPAKPSGKEKADG